MKFGLPTLVECKNLRECAEVAKKCGIDFVEINMSFPMYNAENLDIEQAAKIAKEFGIFYTIHADEAMNPFDFNSKVADCYFDVMKDTIRVAKALNMPVINLHLLKGIYVTLPTEVILLTDVYSDEYISRVKTFIEMCEAEIGDSGLKIAIENVDSNPFTKSQIEAMDLFMASDAFALTLDTGHEMCLDFADKHIYEKFPHKLCHMHLHDCAGKGKSPHIALGRGNVDVSGKLAMMNENDTCVIEVKTIEGLYESVEYLKKMGMCK